MPRKVLSFVLNDFSHDIRVLKEAKSLQSSGYEVIVLALGDPNVSLPRQVNGLPVERLNLKLKNILPAKLFFQVLKYGEIIVKSLPHCLNADIVHCHDFEPLPIAILAKGLRFGRLKIVYDAHELEVERVPK
ncbi:MAG: glycosyltransferase, partial [Bdellovibrionales bacterium]|nr:glycosyltransferase [Bdellovibrionales bacterium]